MLNKYLTIHSRLIEKYDTCIACMKRLKIFPMQRPASIESTLVSLSTTCRLLFVRQKSESRLNQTDFNEVVRYRSFLTFPDTKIGFTKWILRNSQSKRFSIFKSLCSQYNSTNEWKTLLALQPFTSNFRISPTYL